MEVENYPKWKETNIGGTHSPPIMIVRGRVKTTDSRSRAVLKTCIKRKRPLRLGIWRGPGWEKTTSNNKKNTKKIIDKMETEEVQTSFEGIIQFLSFARPSFRCVVDAKDIYCIWQSCVDKTQSWKSELSFSELFGGKSMGCKKLLLLGPERCFFAASVVPTTTCMVSHRPRTHFPGRILVGILKVQW